MSELLNHVHITHTAVTSLELTPPHSPREETSAYRKSHAYLVDRRDTPCQACGVRASTLGSTQENPHGATAIETHHFPIERSLLEAVDPHKVHTRFPQVIDHETLVAFIDSPANLIVLCSACHRSPHRGIHHLLPQDWFILPFLLDGYQVVVTRPEEEVQAMATDEQIETKEKAAEAKEEEEEEKGAPHP